MMTMHIGYWIMILYLPLTIWLSLLFAGLGDYSWCLIPSSLGCFRSPGRPAALAVADNLWGLPTGTSSEGQRSCWSVALPAVDLGGLQTVRSSEEQSNCCLMWRRSPGRPTDYGFCFPVCSRTPGGFQCVGSVVPTQSTPQRFSEYDVCCSVALCAVDLLGCLRLWCQLPNCSQCSRSSGMAQDMVSSGEQTS